jgi:hypothetical protein
MGVRHMLAQVHQFYELTDLWGNEREWERISMSKFKDFSPVVGKEVGS